MQVNRREGITLLWALRSPCNLGCQYCYFGTIDEHKGRTEPQDPGELSHLSRNDIPLRLLLDFAASFSPDIVRRVFVAGGEPLQWAGTNDLVDVLKRQAIEVIVCTNGLALKEPRLCDWLLGIDVDAVSISLDSYDPAYNDHWRVDRSGQGWRGVVNGIETLIRRRRELSGRTKIGIYSVVSRHNITHLQKTAEFVAQLGVDYFIIQPVSLRQDHKLYGELSLDERHSDPLRDAIKTLTGLGLNISLPNKAYLGLFLKTVSRDRLPVVKACFGGRDLFFVEPDGSVWDCPSMYKIADTPDTQRLSMINRSAAEVFSARRRSRNTDCRLLSQDCVNMWQLMAFDEILDQRTT